MLSQLTEGLDGHIETVVNRRLGGGRDRDTLVVRHRRHAPHATRFDSALRSYSWTWMSSIEYSQGADSGPSDIVTWLNSAAATIWSRPSYLWAMPYVIVRSARAAVAGLLPTITPYELVSGCIRIFN